jgi:hypothetical protein
MLSDGVPLGYRVLAIKPFWRWAVVPEDGSQTGLPYYTQPAALTVLSEIRRELPWSKTVLLRKGWFRRVEVVDA